MQLQRLEVLRNLIRHYGYFSISSSQDAYPNTLMMRCDKPSQGIRDATQSSEGDKAGSGNSGSNNKGYQWLNTRPQSRHTTPKLFRMQVKTKE
jgi:hypothetical protein